MEIEQHEKVENYNLLERMEELTGDRFSKMRIAQKVKGEMPLFVAITELQKRIRRELE